MQGFLQKGVIQRLWTYSGKIIILKGVAHLNIKYKEKMYNLRVLIVPGLEPIILRIDMLESLPINLSATCNQIKWTYLNQEFSELFKPGLGTLKNATEKLYIKQNRTSHFMKARSVSLMIQEKVKTELDQMVATSGIKPVDFSEWASPIILNLKRNGQLRICGDFKQTVNPVLLIDSEFR